MSDPNPDQPQDPQPEVPQEPDQGQPEQTPDETPFPDPDNPGQGLPPGVAPDGGEGENQPPAEPQQPGE